MSATVTSDRASYQRRAQEGRLTMASETSEDAPVASTKLPSIVYGPSAPVPLTMTFGQLLDHHAEVRGDRPAIISHPQNQTVSFKQLRNRSLQLARAMAQDGVTKGDLIAISMASRVEYFEVCLTFPRSLL